MYFLNLALLLSKFKLNLLSNSVPLIVKQEIKYLRLMNKNQNNLIVCYLLSHYLNNDKKAFDIYLTCNDFKIKSDINITDFLRKNPSKVC